MNRDRDLRILRTLEAIVRDQAGTPEGEVAALRVRETRARLGMTQAPQGQGPSTGGAKSPPATGAPRSSDGLRRAFAEARRRRKPRGPRPKGAASKAQRGEPEDSALASALLLFLAGMAAASALSSLARGGEEEDEDDGIGEGWL